MIDQAGAYNIEGVQVIIHESVRGRWWADLCGDEITGQYGPFTSASRALSWADYAIRGDL